MLSRTGKAFAWLLGIVVIGLTVGLYGFAFWKTKIVTAAHDGPAEERIISVTVGTVTSRPVQRLVTLVGTLYGREEVPISAEVDGRVARIHHDVGDVVRPGEVLFELDPTDYELAVREAERALEFELARLGLTTVPATEAEFDVERLPSVVRAATQLKWARMQHDRAEELRSRQVVSPEEWDKVEIEFASAKAGQEQAILEARALLASVRQRQAMLDSARERLTETKVVVPNQTQWGDKAVQFVIAQRGVTEGELIRSGRAEPAFLLVIADPLKLEGAIAERFKSEVRVGQKSGLQTETTGDRIFYGTVVRVNPMVDRTSRTFTVEIEFPNSENVLPPGSFAKAAIQTRVDENALTVPAEAIVRFAGVVKVFVADGDRVRGVPISVRENLEIDEKGSVQTWVEVTGSLNAGEIVVTSGQSQLADGTHVEVRKSSSAGESP